MLKNKFLMCALFLGILISVTSAGIIPIYSSALSERMLITELSIAANQGTYPSAYDFSLPFSTLVKEDHRQELQKIESSVDSLFSKALPMEQKSFSEKLISKPLIYERQDVNDISLNTVQAVSYNDLNGYSLLYGVLPKTRSDGRIEALITKNAEISKDLTLNKEYFCHQESSDEGVYIIPVGVIESSAIDDAFIISNEDMNAYFLPNGLVKDVSFNLIFDYTQLKIEDISRVSEANRQINKWLDYLSATKSVPDQSLFDSFLNKNATVEVLIVLFEIPLIFLVIFYLGFVSAYVIKNDKNEIALLLSRGATRKKIILSYLFQSGSLTALALIISVPLSLLTVKFLGTASSFLEFKSTLGLNGQLMPSSLIYMLIASIISIITMLLPCTKLFNTNAVKIKKKNNIKPLWQRIYLDIVLLGISLYGYISFTLTEKEIRSLSGASSIPIEPIIFITVFAFTLGSALLFARLFKLLVSALNAFNKNFSVGVLCAIKNLITQRNGYGMQIFTVVAIVLCIFSANSARSLFSHSMDKFYYSTGADCVIDLDFNTTAIEDTSTENKAETPKPFLFNNFSGVKEETRIITGCAPIVNGSDVTFMGIDTKEFFYVAYCRGDENESHLNAYLNLLGSTPNACLISKTLAEKLSLQKGDAIFIKPTISNNKTIALIVYEIVELFPSFNPYTDAPLIVANSEYIDYMIPNLDFDVWMSLEDGTTMQDISKQINKSYSVNSITVRQEHLDSIRYEATLQASGGILTFNFILIFIILFLGYIIFNILSLKNNTLQFATLRAMGMEEKELTFMLVTEHILTGIIPIIFAVALGYIASVMFVPVLSTAFSLEAQIPSIKIAFNNNDYLKIYALILLLYSVIGIITIPFIKRLQPANAIKLSEE
jgi:putative ABC transport system permease protein